MISQREIERLSEELDVLKDTVDKDWVLGHFMDAIYSVKKLKEVLIFKGGTCLKKCYFPDYRFSEDLDFTATDENFVFTNELLKKVTDHVTKKSGVACHIVSLRDLIYKNQKTGYEAIVKYWGADHAKNVAPPPPERWLTSIKIEIILYEIMLFPAENKDLFHSYSDTLTTHSKQIPCYAIEEVIAEKIRALIQRKYTAPRDYYDIWYLSRNYPKLNGKKIVKAFHEKMKYKELEFTGIEQLINADHERILEKNWKHSLGHQIPKGKLPTCETVVSDVRKYFESIF
jgi:predicted nucleotidyltransferase component of viral defense system